MKYALLLALIACKSQSSVAPPPVTEPLGAVIVSAGEQPRRLVRYALAKDTKAELEIAIDARLDIGELGSSMPTQVFALDVVVEDVLPDGQMRLRSTIVDATARATGSGSDAGSNEVAANALLAHLATMKGTAITATLSPEGKLSNIQLGDGGRPTPDAANLVAAFERIAVPLPHDPVGVGARWVSARDLADNGVHTTATSVVDVTSFDGASLGVRLATELSGPDQQIVLEGMPIDVAHITGTGSGSATIDLAHFQMTSALTLTLHSEMSAQGEKSALALAVHQTVAPRAAQAAPSPQGEQRAP